MRTHLYSTFLNLTKAFGTVNREGLWKIIQKFGCPERFIQMVRQLHDGMMARVTDNGAVSGAFAVTNGVKQGCVLAPTLFSPMFSAMLMDAYHDERPGIRIAYRTDGHLLNQRRTHFQSRVSTTTIHEVLFADDCALNTTSEEEMQRSMDLFSATYVVRDRSTWRRTVKTGAAIYEANRIATVKAKREARKSQLRPARNADAQPLPKFPRCQRTFRARIGLVGHLRINCATRTAPTVVPPSTSSSSSPPPTNSDRSPELPLPSSSSSSTAPTTAALVAVTHINITHIPDTTTDITPTTSDSRGEDQDYTCPHCDRIFISRIGLVGHLRIHRTEPGEPVPGASIYTHRICLHCPHFPRTFTHRMGLFGHMRIHEHLRSPRCLHVVSARESALAFDRESN
ncbi:hypothetical protein SprV_0401627100 [Sparganum proliferum]